MWIEKVASVHIRKIIRGKYIYLFADFGQGIVQKNYVLREKFQAFQIITKNLFKTTDNKQSLKIYLKIGWKMYQVEYVSEKLLGKVSKLRKRSGNSLLFLIEIFTPEFDMTLFILKWKNCWPIPPRNMKVF